ncbi:MAG: hypothetical protein ACK4ZU_03910 [Allorhizobium sp.]
MLSATSTAAERAAFIVEHGYQHLGRRKLIQTLGWSEWDARSALNYLKSTAVSAGAEPAPQPAILDSSLLKSPAASFAERNSVTDLTNWREGWVHERADPVIETETDRKGIQHTRKITYDPGLVWPVGWDGPRKLSDLWMTAARPRPIKSGFLVTAAQAGTPVHGPALMALTAFAGYRGLSMVVIGMDQKVQGPKSKTDEIADWSSAVASLVTTEKLDFGSFVIDGAFPLKTTHEDPLDGIGGYCEGRHHIFGSPRQDVITLHKMESGISDAFARCSGIVTVPNYSRSKAGMIAIGNHVLGAVIVEIDENDQVFTRNIQCHPITGEVWDVGTDVVVEEGIVRGRREVLAKRGLENNRGVFNAGCVHVRWLSSACYDAIWNGSDHDVGLVEVFDPSHQILHDVFDAYSISPHNRRTPEHQIRKRLAGDDSVDGELKLTADFIEAIGCERRTTWIVESNHDRHLDRFLLETDFKKDVKNAKTFLRLNLDRIEALEKGDNKFSVLAQALRLANPRAKFKTSWFSDPLRIHRYFYNVHGDTGTNGSHGSPTNFVGTNFYLAIAHFHTARARRRLVQLGCIIDPPPYAEGLNNTAHCVGIEHPDGSYQLVPLVNGKWRA